MIGKDGNIMRAKARQTTSSVRRSLNPDVMYLADMNNYLTDLQLNLFEQIVEDGHVVETEDYNVRAHLSILRQQRLIESNYKYSDEDGKIFPELNFRGNYFYKHYR